MPDWLATRLMHNVGMPAEQVAALELGQAIAVWEAFMTTPRAGGSG